MIAHSAQCLSVRLPIQRGHSIGMISIGDNLFDSLIGVMFNRYDVNRHDANR